VTPSVKHRVTQTLVTPRKASTAPVKRGRLKTKKNYKNKIAFQSKAYHPWTEHTDTLCCSCDLDLDPMTLI